MIFEQIKTKERNPIKEGWYNTDKGLLYWMDLAEEWSCRNDRVSEEYPSIWYEKVKENSTTEFQLFLDELGVWTTKTFPHQTSVSKLHHLKKEVGELIEAIEGKQWTEEVEHEFADCFTLLFDAARIEGLSLIDIINVMKRKFDINKQRIWGEPDENGVIHHIEEGIENECTNCKTINIVQDSDKTVLGYCTKCGHPLWGKEKEKIIEESVAPQV